MTDINVQEESSEAESGFVEVRTENGDTMNIFVLTARDLEELRPTANAYRQVAAMLLENKPQTIKHLSDRDIINRIVRRTW